MKQMRIGAPPPKSHDWKMGNSTSRGHIFNKDLPKHKTSYTEFEEKFIKENYLNISDSEIAEILQRTKFAITNRRIKMRLIRPLKRVANYNFNICMTYVHQLRREWALVQDMKALIILCQLEKNTFKREKYKKELLILSNLKQVKK